EDGTSVLMVTHDPGHAFFCADTVIMMGQGTVMGIGSPKDVVTEENLKLMYGHDVCVRSVQLPNGESTQVCVPMLV
ncbi:MAG: ABC transporter ATP-binding protein, partial [Coriobacteriia bacterium]|nr:ABC transporter ATP-binding protein [Coriobacteriia bacterium]